MKLAAVALTLLALVACGKDSKSSGGKQTPKPAAAAPEADSPATPAGDTAAADGTAYTCDQVAAHVATITMAEPKDAPMENDRLRPPDVGVARANARTRCTRAKFSQEHMRCVMAGKSRADFVACKLPK